MVPTKAQLEWQDLENYLFIHFGPNTFTDKKWEDGKEDPKVFNPMQFDTRQWARTAKRAQLHFRKAMTFNRLLLQEYIAPGQRVQRFRVEVPDHGQYKEIANETTIGHKRILLLPATKTREVRITITGAKACPVLSEVQLFNAPKG
ncbi:discoidin domain-containing protein [Chitinophaga sp.]|uniref:discoidin domain-containing protein n=1 Tax=Chitinophaga sp. TaxID=1869181 RepID=UPI0031D1B21C